MAPILQFRVKALLESFVDVEDLFRGDSAVPYISQRKAKIRDAIAQRLRRVCSDMPETEFQQMVEDIADKQLRGERRLSDI